MAGKVAYRLRREAIKEERLRMSKELEDRRRREEKADILVELAMDAINSFLKGEVAIVVEDQKTGKKTIRLQLDTLK